MLCGLGLLFRFLLFFFPSFDQLPSHFTFIYIVRNVAILLLGHMRSSSSASSFLCISSPRLCFALSFWRNTCEHFLIFAPFCGFYFDSTISKTLPQVQIKNAFVFPYFYSHKHLYCLVSGAHRAISSCLLKLLYCTIFF